MSKESPPVREVVPYKPGKRQSTFRKLNLDFAGTALEEALARQQQQLGGDEKAEATEIPPLTPVTGVRDEPAIEEPSSKDSTSIDGTTSLTPVTPLTSETGVRGVTGVREDVLSVETMSLLNGSSIVGSSLTPVTGVREVISVALASSSPSCCCWRASASSSAVPAKSRFSLRKVD